MPPDKLKPLPEIKTFRPAPTVNESQLKVEINNFIWMHGPEEMTLHDADKMAVKILDLFLESHDTHA